MNETNEWEWKFVEKISYLIPKKRIPPAKRFKCCFPERRKRFAIFLTIRKHTQRYNNMCIGNVCIHCIKWLNQNKNIQDLDTEMCLALQPNLHRVVGLVISQAYKIGFFCWNTHNTWQKILLLLSFHKQILNAFLNNKVFYLSKSMIFILYILNICNI